MDVLSIASHQEKMLVMLCVYLFDHLNNLEIIRLQFGAKFIFKVFSNYVFKENLQNLGF
jgi:hypothetical protein